MIIILSVFFLNACKDHQQTKQDDKIAEVKSEEVSLEQKPQVLKNEAGEEITVIYFAEGDKVAVRIKKSGQEEKKLSAKTTSVTGNPIFTSEELMWEMTDDGAAGKLSGKTGQPVQYRKAE